MIYQSVSWPPLKKIRGGSEGMVPKIAFSILGMQQKLELTPRLRSENYEPLAQLYVTLLLSYETVAVIENAKI
jgi:hypothetical protein